MKSLDKQGDGNRTYRLYENVLFQKVADEVVILEPESGKYFTLDATGAFMLAQMQAGLTFAEVIDKVLACYDVERARAEHDLRKLLAEMESNKLMTPVIADG